MSLSLKIILLVATTIYQAIACHLENQKPPPGKLFDVGGYRLNLYVVGEASPTIILDHSLGGIEGYFLVEKLAKLGRVCIYDRAGYGWSEHSPHPRTSSQIVTELDTLLNQAKIQPPYILVGNSFGSYNVRLYAHRFPEKVIGMVLIDGLYETEMLKMPIQLQALKLLFISGFVMSILGSILGIIQLLRKCGIFELIKPELRQFSQESRNHVKHSFCRSKHWITMSREILNLNNSGNQVIIANQFASMPVVSIKANSFFHPSWWTFLIPLKSANKLREQMHKKLCNLSTNCVQIQANKSSHFVWIDEPSLIVDGVKILLDKLNQTTSTT
ncbi:MAG: alpha/beta hydrolase [Okeania sp. SIO2C2]|uniref:alpha/beta fold hydrolase n=1 Tax=Okeania sp. SIO2C2 TaxID=2607787 RepID=UPI0013B5BD3A|nr:alpha/beta hydrolase [Okeania sp. SIO2C2]NEP90896.1 alpha/beta hydrolase [Okeania sp. SIO2C2]